MTASTPLPEQKLFRVKYVSQQTGQLIEGYFICSSLAVLEREIADITEIHPLSFEVLGDD